MEKILEAMLQDKIVSIIRGVASQQIIPAVAALEAGGVRFVEVTFNPADEAASADTLRSIKLLQNIFGSRMHIGAGTVLSVEQVEQAAAAGAEFVISPNMNPAVICRTKEKGLIAMPGAYTPTEAQAAWEAGADIVKIFPADQLGPNYFKALKAPLSQLHLAAVGGVSEQNIQDFARAGADCFGIASNLVNANRVQRQAWQEIEAAARRYRERIKSLTC